MVPPRQKMILANGLLHHVSTWEPEAPPHHGTILCAHGFLDVGQSFHWLATALARRGHRVVAFDWRGHGKTDWLPEGAYYHFFDYVADLDALVDQLAVGPLTLVGHSMGGTASVLFAGARQEKVEKLVLLEGLGPEAPEAIPGPERVRRWMDAVKIARSRPRRTMASLDEAADRILAKNPSLSEEAARQIASWSVKEVEGDSGRSFVWSFDPVHRTRGPYPFRPELFLEFLRSLRMPVLSIEGENGYRTRDHEERHRALGEARRVVAPGVGHMLHWFAPDLLAEEISRFVLG